MKTNYPARTYTISILIFLFISSISFAQVGIGNTSPNADALLDVGTDTSTAGIRLPRVALTGTANAAPLSAHVQGMMVYNTATVGDVLPGQYYNDGAKWILLASDDWKLTGNTGTSPLTNFIGTIDNASLLFKTNNTDALTISTSQQLLANGSGGTSTPTYSFASDPNVGMWQSGTDRLNLVAGGREFIELFEGTNDELRFNDGSRDINLRVETDGDQNALFVDGANNNIGIGTGTPNTSAQLEMADNTRGILINRVTLSAIDNASPVTSPATGLLVYNTATAGSGSLAVSPGFYYWDSSQWVAMGGTNGNDWSLTGNAGTTAGTNFLGTTDNISLELFTNNTTRMRVENDGQVSIGFGAGAVNTDEQFNVGSTYTDGTAIGGYSGGSGIGVYGQNISNGVGVRGTNNSSGRGVYGTNSSSGQGVRGWSSGTGFGIFGSSTSASAEALGAKNYSSGTAIIAVGNNGALYNFTGSGGTFNGTTGLLGLTTSATGTGISGIGNASTTSRTLTDGSGVAGSGDTGVYGISTATNGTGIIGVGDLTTSITTNLSGSGVAGSSLSLGIFGYAGNGDTSDINRGNAGGEFILDADNDPTTITGDNGSRARAVLAGFDLVTPDGSASNQESYFGGYFSGGSQSSGTPSYAYAGMRYNTNTNGTSGTDYKIIGTGTNSTLINDSNGTPRIMFSPEAPEILFQDFGVGQLVNGQVRINLDPLLKGSLFIDNEHPLKVYVTLEGECNGIYVTNKTADGFTVKELQGGTSNVSFSWQIVANRADTKDRNGRIVSKHVGLRLPVGPGPIASKTKKVERKAEQAKTEKTELADNEELIISKENKDSILKSLVPVKNN